MITDVIMGKVLTAAELIKVLNEVPPDTTVCITCETQQGSSLLSVKRTGYGSMDSEPDKMYFFLEFTASHLSEGYDL